jgi:wyosine [tRNA(Phe)-imidazoG37] synthetase (radical SAM superfamily)
MSDQSVQKDLNEADLVCVKLDSVVKEVWKAINKPVPYLRFEKILEGIQQFAAMYKGKLVTDTMLLQGINDAIPDISELVGFVSKIQPTASYLSVPIRPTAEKQALLPDQTRMNEIVEMFQKYVTTYKLTAVDEVEVGVTGNAYHDILSITAVHPLSEDSLAYILKNDKADQIVMESLLSQGLLKQTLYNGKPYYVRNYNKANL